MFFKKSSNLIFLLINFISIQSLFAEKSYSHPVYFNTLSHFSNYVITISGGPAWTKTGKTQTFYVQPDVQNTYAASNKTNSLTTGELFLGLQYTLSEQFNGQLGLAIAGSSMADLSGQIWQDADANYNNFNYSYHVSQFRLGLKGKLISLVNPIIPRIQFYISGSVGIGFNRAFNYQATPTISEAVAAPNFTSKTTTALTYTLGVGIQKSFHTHWQIGLGYEFADWGQSNLGSALGQTINSELHLNHLYTNELQFSISYIA